MVPIEVEGDVPQANTCLLYFPLTDYDGVEPVSVDNVSSLTMNLFVDDTKELIGDADRDVKNSLNQAGIFAHVLTAADNQIISDSEAITEQKHTAVIKIVGTGAESRAITFEREFAITILNQKHVANVSPA